MQMVSPPPPPPPTAACSANHPHIHARSSRRISFKIAHVPHTSSATNPSVSSPTGATFTAAENAMPMSNPRLGVVDLTDSPVPSPCSSNPSISLSPSSFTSAMSLAAPASRAGEPRSSALPPRLLPTSQSTPDFPVPAPTLTPITLAPSIQAPSPRRRPTFILPSDVESDRDRDQGEVHDDSDDSDRTSFFSAEEFLVPANALRDAVNAGSKVVDVQVGHRAGHGWQSLEQESEPVPEPVHETRGHQDAKHAGEEQDTTYELRRWHALMEIVHTEAGYVRDLRVLVNVYLGLLPSLPLSALAHQAVQELSREASQLLSLHERFLLSLERASAQAAGGASLIGSVDEAVRQVAGLFIDEALTFDLYQQFCTAQPDALRLLRPAQARSEWAAYEQRCAAGGVEATESDTAPAKESQDLEYSETPNGVPRVPPASAPASTSAAIPTRPPSRRAIPPRTLSLMPSAFKAYASSSPSSQPNGFPSTSRRHSYDSLVAVFGASSSGNVRRRPSSTRPSSEGSVSSTTRPPTPNSRLRFQDFLIKPVQRICKYPLMLEALRSKTHEETADAAVAKAVDSMRAVATRVDDARRQKEAETRSKLIVDRIEPHTILKPEFIKSLGHCLLAGSLDVVHHHHVLDPVTTPVRVRYMGAFLYLGGYLLLVKVGKSKVYHVKHWFSLASFELVDIPQETALVPCSFRLSYMDHHFEIAAACQREKNLWMRAINDARLSPPTWSCEPASSLQTAQSDLPASTPPTDVDASEAIEPPVTLARGSSTSSLTDQSNPLAVLRLSTTRNRMSTSNPTVRMFSLTDGSSILLRRSSATNRACVDRGLVDVLSDLVFSLRRQAQAHDETLFPPPQFSDASQTISIAAKNRLMRRGSMLVARPRTLLTPGTVAADSEDDVSEQSSSAIRRKQRTRMSLLPALSVLYTEPEGTIDTSAGVCRTELQVPGSGAFDKSHTPSGAMSLPSSPTIESQQLCQLSSSEGTDDIPHNHRRARSLVGSVKHLVRRATTKRNVTQQSTDTWQVLRVPGDSSDTGPVTETAAKSSVGRRRVSSAPTSPPLTSPSCVLISDSISRPPSTTIDDPVPQTDLPSSSLPTAPALKPVVDKKSGSIPSDSDHTLNPRRSFKSFIFYNRLSAVDPA